MAGHLIAEEGPLAGLVISFEEGEEWLLGRDPDEATLVLEDPMVSRKHVICRLTTEGFILENLSSVNPATQNGKVITEPVLLREGDILQIGSTFFRFTEKEPSLDESKEEEAREPVAFEETEDLSSVSFGASGDTRWMIKVIAGPNAGAEFSLQKSTTHILGKDPNLCDIIFQDLSVSRQHARISVDEEENVFIEDLGSRNGVIVNGELISTKKQLSSQDLVSLGTTSFLAIDREQIHETIISPPSVVTIRPEGGERETPEELAAPAVEAAAVAKDWREMIISTRHLIWAAAFGLLLIITIAAMFSLFKSEPVVVHEKNESEEIQMALKGFDAIQFSFNVANGKIFLSGHVLTSIDKQELMYKIKNLPFVEGVEDNVVIDEYVWQNMNALIMMNDNWLGVSIHSPAPGKFVMRGYLQSIEQAQALNDYINMNFPYLDSLENQTVVESDLSMQIQGLLIEKGFSGVTFQLSNGELVLAGRVDGRMSSSFNETIDLFKGLRGIRQVKNFVVHTTADSSRVDISKQYQVSGYSRKDEKNLFVVINGRILTLGDALDGMTITSILANMVLLEKDGIKFRINYNLQ